MTDGFLWFCSYYTTKLRSHLKTRTAIERVAKTFAFRRPKPYIMRLQDGVPLRNLIRH